MKTQAATAASHSSPPAFRSDIEGLRALAILLVVAAHTGLAGLEGGFVGVDVFFVLSGFLITSQLKQELQNSHRIDFARFWARRARRLLPMLVVVISASCLFAWWLYPPGGLPDQARSATAAAVWISNLHFAFSDLDYFAPQSAGNLLLHTWSLSVEEQFYLLWPFLVALGWRLGMLRLRPQEGLATTLILVFLLSLVACSALSKSHPLLAFYMMPMRAWEFALGGIVYLLFQDQLDSDRRRNLGACVGIGLILLAAALFKANHTSPAIYALPPTLGTALLLAAGSRNGLHPVGRVLSWRPMQWLGRHSYAIYLWHWPVLILGGELWGTSTANRLACVGAAVLLAWISHRWIEAPVRQQTWWVVRPRTGLLFALGCSLLAVLVAQSLKTAAEARLKSPGFQEYWQQTADLPVIYSLGCDDWYHSDVLRPCVSTADPARFTAVVVGDSIGLQWFPAYAQLFAPPEWRLVVLTKSSCPLVDVPFFYSRIGREYVECASWRQKAIARIAELKPDIVIWGSSHTYGFSEAEWTQGSRRLLDRVSQAAGMIYLIRSTPVLPFNAAHCAAPRSTVHRLLAGENHCSSQAQDPLNDQVYQWLSQAAKGYDNVKAVDLNPAVCPSGVCNAISSGQLTYRDNQHLTARYAESLAPAVAARLDLPVALPNTPP